MRNHRALLSALSLFPLATACAGFDARKLAASAGDLVLRRPLENKCLDQKLQGCGELVDGMLLYVEGKKDEANRQLLTAAAKNSPTELRAFALSLKMLSDVPGVREKLGVIAEASDFIVANAGQGRPFEPARDPQPESAPRLALPVMVNAPFSGSARTLTADTDPEQLDAGIAAPGEAALRWSCGPSGSGFDCVSLVRGPFVLESAQVVGACPGRMSLSLSREESVSGAPRWALTGKGQGLSVQGARLLIRRGEVMLAGIEHGADLRDKRCAIAWSGFRPYADSNPAMAAPAAIVVERKAPASVAPETLAKPAPTSPSAAVDRGPAALATTEALMPASMRILPPAAIVARSISPAAPASPPDPVALPGTAVHVQPEGDPAMELLPLEGSPSLKKDAAQRDWFVTAGPAFMTFGDRHYYSYGGAQLSAERLYSGFGPIGLVLRAGFDVVNLSNGWATLTRGVFALKGPIESPVSLSVGAGVGYFGSATPGVGLPLEATVDLVPGRWGFRLLGRMMPTNSLTVWSAGAAGLVAF